MTPTRKPHGKLADADTAAAQHRTRPSRDGDIAFLSMTSCHWHAKKHNTRRKAAAREKARHAAKGSGTRKSTTRGERQRHAKKHDTRRNEAAREKARHAAKGRGTRESPTRAEMAAHALKHDNPRMPG